MSGSDQSEQPSGDQTTQPSGPSGNFFPPGLAVRQISPTDNEAVRALFIAAQNDILPDGADRATRIALKKYTDSCLMADLARASTHYAQPGRRMWVLESQEHEIVALAAIDSEPDDLSSAREIALFRRLAVRPEFKRKGVGTLLSKRAEQWAAKQGFATLKLYVSELQPAARSLYEKLEYSEIGSEDYGPIAVFEMEKSLSARKTTA